jgi:methionyl-tRNA formyltransferase
LIIKHSIANTYSHAKMMAMPKRIIFMGSPEFAVPILINLQKEYFIPAVVTQQDRPSGRGGKVETSPVKEAALLLGLTILQPEKVRTEEFFSVLSDSKSDLIVVAAYGQILPKKILELPAFGCINVHASLLPRWRGASPIQSAILAGDPVTGVTIMMMDEGLDTGPVLSQKTIPIDKDDNYLSLSQKLSVAGADLLIETMQGYFSGQIVPVKQLEEKATKTKLIKKIDGKLNFQNPAQYLEKMIRAFYPWPGAFFDWSESQIKVIKGHANPNQPLTIGEHKVIEKKPAIGTGEGFLILDLLQPSGKRVMQGEEFLNGARDWLKS